MSLTIIPVAAVIATKDRAASLGRTLDSLAAQGVLPAEVIAVDGSVGDDSRRVLENWGAKFASQIAVRWQRAEKLGAAIQRNQGIVAVTQPFVLFVDDDILFEPECVSRLWRAMAADPQLGGVNAMITNQQYHPPGRVSRALFTLLHGRREHSFAGLIIGPAVNLLPEDRSDLPEVVPVEWLNTTCTLYRREALPHPPFDSIFTGYSMMEDVTLSVRVGRTWHLANARTARIFHDSQLGAHKADVSALAAMELVNRHYVMTQVLRRDQWRDFLRLFVWEAFQMAVGAARADSRRKLPALWRGKWQAVKKICAAPCTLQ
jgi:glycosyltransferase involved in cell wall biosynthesis